MSIKVTPAAHQSARMIAAFTGQRQYQVIERLLAAELRQLGLGKKPPRAVAPTKGA